MPEVEIQELIQQVEARGFKIVRCEHEPGRTPGGTQVPLCGEPAVGRVNGLDVCLKCYEAICKEELRRKYGCSPECLPANEEVLRTIHRLAMDGKAPEDISHHLVQATGRTLEEWDEIEEYTHGAKKPEVWIVWGAVQGSLWWYKERKMLVLARSAQEAKRLWRERLYKRKCDNIPNECQAKRIAGRVDPMVLSTSPDSDLEIKLGVYD